MKTLAKSILAASVVAQSLVVTAPVMAGENDCTCAVNSLGTAASMSVLSGTATLTSANGPVALSAGQSGKLIKGSEITTGNDSIVRVALGGNCVTNISANSIATIGHHQDNSKICVKFAEQNADLLNAEASYGADLVLDEVVEDPDIAAPAPTAPSGNIYAALIGLAAVGGIVALIANASSSSD